MKYENLLECLNENNGLIRDWGKIKHTNESLNGKTAVVVDNLAEGQSLLLPYHEQIDFILHSEEYVKCDCCQSIVPIEDTKIVDEEDLLCSDCQTSCE